MDIQRINSYDDRRFSQRVLYQHGCFLVDGKPYEIEITSEKEAVVRGEDTSVFTELIDGFRFFTPHITVFYDRTGGLIKRFPDNPPFCVPLDLIQPSQFYVDLDKVRAVGSFISSPEDIIIQVLPFEGKYISLDGHTRLYYAVTQGWSYVRAVAEESDDWVFRFVEEAKKRNVTSPCDLIPLDHGEYEVKWNGFCDDFFANQEE